jgi:hypothetical protein
MVLDLSEEESDKLTVLSMDLDRVYRGSRSYCNI